MIRLKFSSDAVDKKLAQEIRGCVPYVKNRLDVSTGIYGICVSTSKRPICLTIRGPCSMQYLSWYGVSEDGTLWKPCNSHPLKCDPMIATVSTYHNPLVMAYSHQIFSSIEEYKLMIMMTVSFSNPKFHHAHTSLLLTSNHFCSEDVVHI